MCLKSIDDKLPLEKESTAMRTKGHLGKGPGYILLKTQIKEIRCG